jgi:aspartate-semialdehyde dehydrogenase
MLRILEERNFPLSDLRLLASQRSAGTIVSTRWGDVVVEDLANADPDGLALALFSAGGDRSREHAPRFASAGAVVIDNSSAFRMDSDVPLVVVDVNNDAAFGHRGIIANPNCTTMTVMMAAAPLHNAATLRSMVATSFQAVSGSGQQGVSELVGQMGLLGNDLDALMGGGWEDPGAIIFERPIAYNTLPFAGSQVEGGYTDEEMKLVNESRKILDIPGLELWKDRTPTPLDSAGIDEVLTGRVRNTLGEQGGINLWVVGDNLRKGAALNAVQIAELLVG